MGARFGFSVLFIWQPILPEIDKPLAAEEVGMLANLGDMSLTPEVYERMRARSASSNLLDMQDVFAGDSAARWIDFVHLNPDGNRLVAARIESVIAAVLQQSSGARVRTSRGGSTAGPRR
jgi:lysophospholipase L1-like esterase